jgi:hypothetical protein
MADAKGLTPLADPRRIGQKSGLREGLRRGRRLRGFHRACWEPFSRQ